jgi:hypothetical protein
MFVSPLTLQLTDYCHTPLENPVFSSFMVTEVRAILKRKLTYIFYTLINTFNNINISTIYMYNICVKLAIDNTTTADINYKELYDCKLDPVTFLNNTLYTPAFNFHKYFGLMMACIGRN